MMLPDGQYYGEFKPGDFVVAKDGITTPLGEHPDYAFSQENVEAALAAAFA